MSHFFGLIVAVQVTRWLAERGVRATADDQQDADLAKAFHQLDPSRYPATVAVADELPVPLAEEFVFGLRLSVAGLERLLM